MSDPNPPAPTPELPAEPQAAPDRTRPLWIALAVLAVLAAAGWLFLYQATQRLAERPYGADPGRVAALEAQLRTLTQRLAPLEQRAIPDTRPLEGRIAALEQRPAASSAPDISGALAPMAGQIQALEQRLAEASRRAGEADRRAAEAEQQANATAARAARLARVQAATAALDAGQKLGDLPGAPPALSRFATIAPPTEAALRLSFPAAARAAEAAGTPTGAAGVLDRMWDRVQGLVTVRAGEQVIVGAPATRVLARAQARLDAGDLAGAVAALDALDPEAARAIAPWRTEAQALLDARAALAALSRS